MPGQNFEVALGMLVSVFLLISFIFYLIHHAEKDRKKEADMRIQAEKERKAIQEAARLEEEWEALRRQELENNRVRVVSKPVLTMGSLIEEGKTFIIEKIYPYPSMYYGDMGDRFQLTDLNDKEITGEMIYATTLPGGTSVHYANGSWDWMTRDEAEYLYRVIEENYEVQKEKRVQESKQKERNKFIDRYCGEKNA